MRPVFVKDKGGINLCLPQNFSQQKGGTSTDLHVSNGSGSVSMCYASHAAAAGLS